MSNRTPQIILSRESQLDGLERLSKNLRARRNGPTTPQERRDLGYRIEAIESQINELRREGNRAIARASRSGGAFYGTRKH